MKTTMPESCEHAWKRGPVRDHRLRRYAVTCPKCGAGDTWTHDRASVLPKWTYADYQALISDGVIDDRNA